MSKEWIFHNSHEIKYRKPFGAVPCLDEITIRLEESAELLPHNVLLRIWFNGQEKIIKMKKEKDDMGKRLYKAQFKAPENPGLLWYYFIINFKDEKIYYGNNSEKLGGIGSRWWQEPPSYQITVYQKDYVIPQWFKDSIMYHIFVDRFYNGSDKQRFHYKKHNKYKYSYRDWQEPVPLYDRHPITGAIQSYDIYGGNLKGIIEKLSYLKDLGVNVLYLSPIFESPSNHKYDVGNYKKIDPSFGDNKIYQDLCKKANKLGMSIVLDGVFSHTGSDSIYFNKEGNYPELGAYQSKESPYYKWYTFTNYPDEYECWWGIDTLPNTKELEPSYLDFIINDKESVLKYWMAQGTKGWRLDVADELPDKFIKDFRKTLKDIDPESILIGEVWEDASNKKSYGIMREYLYGEELDSVMNYPLRQIIIDFLIHKNNAQRTAQLLTQIHENYPRETIYSNMNILSSHDVPRVLTLLGGPPEDALTKEKQFNYKLSKEERNLAVDRLKLASLMQMTLPGVPCIYYGDEVGMEGYKDPLNRGPFPWDKMDREIFMWYKKLIKFRHQYDVLKTGRFITIYAQDDIYAFIRVFENNQDVFGKNKKNNFALVLLNKHETKEKFLNLEIVNYSPTKLYDVLERDQEIWVNNGILNIKLEPLQGKLLIQNI